MRLLRLRLRDFRGVADRELEFGDHGVTVVLGDNETGKSSLLEAFGLLLELPADSKHSRVRDVRPIGRDVGTEVDAEFTLGVADASLRLRYRKRWFSDRLTELRVEQSDGAVRSFTGREAHDEALRLFEEHIDRTLWSALVVEQEETVRLPAADATAGVLGGLDPSDAGRRADAAEPADVGGRLTDRLEREYLRYFTAKGRPTGEYAQAMTDVEELTAEVAAAERAAAAVSDDIHRAERLTQDIERLSGLLDERSAEVARLTETKRTAAAQLAELDRLRAAVELARERLRSAEAARAQRAALTAEVSTRAAAVTAAVAERDAAIASGGAAEERLAEQAATLRSAREHQSAARAETGRLDAHLSALRDRAELADLEAKSAAVEQARAAEQAARAVLEDNPVDAESVERVEQVHRELLAARAAVEAGAPRLAVRRLGSTGITVDGVALGDEEVDLVVGSDTVVSVTDSVEVTVRPGAGVAELRAAVERAEHAEQSMLAELEVPDVAAARRAARTRADAEQALAAAVASVRDRLGGSTQQELADRLASARARCSAAERSAAEHRRDLVDVVQALPDDIDTIRAMLESARGAEAEASARLDEATLAEAAARKEFAVADQAATGARIRIEQETERQAEAVATLDAARGLCGDDELDDRMAAAAAAVDAQAADLDLVERRVAEGGIDRIDEELAAAERLRDQLAAEVASCRGDLRQAEGRLEQAGAQGIASALDRARAEKAGAERRLEMLDRRARAAARLRSTVERHRAEAHRRYAAPLRERIDALGRQVLGPTFGVVLDTDLSVVARTVADVQVPVTSLSTGAREQLATIVRLAIAGLAATGGEGVPVILDDALGWSDPGRLRAMGALLARSGETGQVVLLTSVPERYALVPGARVVRVTAGR